MSSINQENLIRLANVCGLDIDSTQDSWALADALRGVQQPMGLITYVRKHRESVKFEAKTVRLDILSQKYKLKELDHGLIVEFKKVEDELELLYQKVMSCFRLSARDNFVWERVKVRDKENKLKRLFSDKEILMLNEIGSFEMVIEYAQTQRLLDKVKRKTKQNIRKNKVKELRSTANVKVQKNVASLIKQTVRKM